MFNPLQTEQLMQEYCRAALREAEQARLVQMVMAQRPRRRWPLRSRVAWVGRQMVRWGSRLEAYDCEPGCATPMIRGV